MRPIRLLLALLPILLLAVLGLMLWYRQASLPVQEGTLNVAGLEHPVRILRDDAGVPSISADSEADALFALGFVHAQDRLWQMEFERRLGQGRLAELLGPDALPTDRFLRTIGIARRAQSMVAEQDGEMLALLQSYCAGINAYLDSRQDPLPPEFVLLRAPRPAHWVPADVMAWTLMMAWDLASDNMRGEIKRLRLASRFSKAEIDDLLPSWDPAPPAVADYVQMYRKWGLPQTSMADRAAALARLDPVDAFDTASQGSNNWVVSGSRTVSGRPLLANDPHLGLTAPSVWYFARLAAPGLDVFGATLPGIPYVVLGRNAHVAWGFTNTHADTQDLYLERVEPEHPDRYLAPDGYQPFVTRIETIQVRGAESEALQVRSTRHGPVISGALGAADAAMARDSGYVLALCWSALEPGDASMQAFRAMNRARDTVQFERALRDIGPIVQNVVFAGDDGHIGFRVAGRVPVRRADNDLFGAAPAPGWDPRYDWQRWMDPDELPHLLDPPSGVVVTANQKVTPPGYAGFVTTGWQAPFRAHRIEQRLAETARHSVASFESIQADATSLAADEMMVALVNAQPQTELGRAALQRLRVWDGSMRANAPQPLIYEAWVRRLKQRLFGAALGPLAADIIEPDTMIGAMLGVLTGRAQARRWCAEATAGSTATAVAAVAAAPAQGRNDCMRLAGEALDQAAAEWAHTPADLDRLRWGRQHRAVFEHRPLSRVNLLRGWFEPGVADSGDDFTVNVGHLRLKGARPYEATSGPSMRTIFDLSSPTAGVWMFAPGQSGNLFSVHYDDLVEAWGKVRYRPVEPGRAEPLRLLLKPVSHDANDRHIP